MSLLLYQDIKWLLGVMEESKSAVETMDARNFLSVQKALSEENFIKSASLGKKVAEWNRDHQALKAEFEVPCLLSFPFKRLLKRISRDIDELGKPSIQKSGFLRLFFKSDAL